MIKRIGRFLGVRRRILFTRCQRHLHGPFELWIPALAPGLGIELYFDVRVGAMHDLPWEDGAFDVVTSFRGIWGTTRDVRTAATCGTCPGCGRTSQTP